MRLSTKRRAVGRTVLVLSVGVLVLLALLAYTSLELSEAQDSQPTSPPTALIVTTTMTTTIFVGTPSTITITTTVTQISTTIPALFELVFQQVAKCPSIGYLAPWRVTLSNGESITAPPNGNISQGYFSGSPTNPQTITFYVTNGNYAFSVSGASNSLTPAVGNVTVNNQDVLATLYQGGVPFSCGSSTTTTTATTS